MMTLKNISLTLGDHKILSDISLDVPAGEILIILGSNGSGKSSLLKLIDKRYAAQQGEISLNGLSLMKYSPQALSRLIVTLSQNPLDSLFSHLTVRENCQLAMKRSHLTHLPKNYLADFNPNLEAHEQSLAGQLSGGEQQSLALALACLAKPKILLLDEHTSALDPHTAERLMRLTIEKAKAHRITCLLTTHQLEFARLYGSRLIALQQGKIICDFNQTEKTQMKVEDLKKFCYAKVS